MGGLAAALRLSELGFRVTVLERAPMPGGRVSSVPVPGFAIEAEGRRYDKLQDVGAQFLSDRYGTLFSLLKQSGASLSPLPLSTRSATLRGGKALVVDGARPFTLVDSGLVDFASAARVKVAYDLAEYNVRDLPLDDFAAWGAVDRGTARQWLDEHYGDVGARYLGDPAIETLFFHRPEETSKAFFLWLIANHAAVSQWLTLAGHTASIPAAFARALVARKVDVRFLVEAVSVAEDGPAARVRVQLRDGSALDADGAIVATPGPVSRRLLAKPTAAQAAIVEGGYASTIVVNFHCARAFAPLHRDGAIGGVNVPAVERRGVIAGLSIESGKYPDAAREGTLRGHEIYGLHLTDAGARKRLTESDEVIARTVRRELESYIPGILASERGAVVKRWEHAIPLSPPGRAIALDAFWREQHDAPGRILLAGDQTTFATLDAAARSGVVAAEALARRA